MWDIFLFVICILAVVSLWIVIYDTSRFVIKKHEIKSARIHDKYRAVVLADLHNKRFGKDNELLLAAIREQKPDGIWIAGDMLTARPRRDMSPAIRFLTALSKEYPIYYANGNHEHRIKLYPEKYADMAQRYEEALKEIGIEPMVNSGCLLEKQNIMIYGLEISKEYYKRFTIPEMKGSYLNDTLGRPQKDMYNVLLAHNPDYFLAYAAWGADVVFSGHVHGGLVRIPGGKGLISPNVRFFPKYDGGKFVEGNSTMILSRGLGVHTIPVRMFNPGEVIVVDFKGEKEE